MNNIDDNSYFLTIVIPTYNGAPYIRNAIDSITSQLDKIDEDIEILISDNASTDQTANIVAEYQKKYKYIHYFCNSVNLGGDRNYDIAVRRASGKYVWLFSDDDLILPGAIEKVIHVLRNNDQISNILINHLEDNKPSFSIKGDRKINSADEFFNVFGFSCIAVSINIILRRFWIEMDTKKYFDTYWIHFGVISESLINHKDYSPYYIADPCGMPQSKDRCRWNEKGKIFLISLNLIKIIDSMTEIGYETETVTKLKKPLLKNLFKTIISAKLNGLPDDRKIIIDTYDICKFYFSFWMLDLPVLIIPTKIYTSRPVKMIHGLIKER